MTGLVFIHACEREYEFKPPYDLILLDHDLGGRQLAEHEDCGLTFVRMIKDKINPEAVVIIHSFNPCGAMNMAQELGSQAVVIPFGSYKFQDAIDRVRYTLEAKYEQSKHTSVQTS